MKIAEAYIEKEKIDAERHDTPHSHYKSGNDQWLGRFHKFPEKNQWGNIENNAEELKSGKYI